MKKKKNIIIVGFFLFFHPLFSSEPLYSFKGNEKVLDIYCGEGDSSLTLAKIVRKGAVVGVDFSMSVIESAKRKHLQSPSHLSFKYKELQDLTFSEAFDVVTCFSLKQSVVNQSELLKKVYVLLKPKGYLDIQVIAKIPVALQSAIKAVITTERWSDYFLTFHPQWDFYKEEEYKTLLKQQSYKSIELSRFSVDEIFSSVEKFQEFMIGWLPYFSAVPLNLKKEFLDDFTQRYLKIFPVDSLGRVHFLIEKLEILAQKA